MIGGCRRKNPALLTDSASLCAWLLGSFILSANSHLATAVQDWDEAMAVHVEDSLTLMPIIGRLGGTTGPYHVLDVGTGGGFPGMGLAIACPHWQVCQRNLSLRQVAGSNHPVCSCTSARQAAAWKGGLCSSAGNIVRLCTKEVHLFGEQPGLAPAFKCQCGLGQGRDGRPGLGAPRGGVRAVLHLSLQSELHLCVYT